MNTFKTLRNIFFAGFAAATLFSAANTAEAASYAGLWYDHTGRSAVQISRCGSGLCGRIVWLRNKTHETVCGKNIIGGGHKVGNVYDNGWIYDPERRRKFNVELELVSSGKLRVMGYAGSKMLSKTMFWHRAPGNLERCG